ncbi:oxygenase MpaB family protein [Aspergillus lucknowensis]|uniref:ER-bound oxygenase mpaB/mpaB'/Rubber oxygenase catalytic domain-containing protein n=1 Tax=Aspergillus lucknowensis TaxID=176173 RepID=A0ABR4LCU2_9EURO
MSVTTNKKGNRVEYHYWDYSFEWTDQHRPGSELEPWTRTCDTLADECNAILDALPASAEDPSKRDRYALLRDNHASDPKLEELWTQINTVPEWVDWEQIQRGQDLFWRYLVPITNALTFVSLLGGMGAIRVGEILSRTGGFGAKVVRRRLLETVQHTIQVNNSPEAMHPGGEGALASVRVRLLHSAVRRKIMGLVEQDPTYYDANRFGIPINDLDSFATINTFSSTVIWLGLPRQGITLTSQQEEDYVALWRLVAYYMGAPTEPFESAAKAKLVSESLLVNEFKPTDTGRILARNITIGLENTAPIYASLEYMDALTRLLNGEQLSDELHIPKTSLYYRVLMWGYCFWVQVQAKTLPFIPAVDRHLIASRKKFFWKHLMDEKDGLGKETVFDFKYVPGLKRRTRLGERKKYFFKKPGIEILSYLGLLSAFGFAATFSTGLYFVITRAFPQTR